MAVRNITITKGYPDTGTLVLTDHSHTAANPRDTVQWHIHPQSGVQSIIAIQGKSGSPNIWRIRPLRGNHWRGEIISQELNCTFIYSYSITWSDGSGSYIYDPIISINPDKKNLKRRSRKDSLIPWLVPFLGLLGISLLLWRKKKGSK